MIDQDWSRRTSTDPAESEGINLTDRQRDVMGYLRKQCLAHGPPEFARTTMVRDRTRQFTARGGNRYPDGLFTGSRVIQGGRLASLRTPVNATDDSFGTRY